MNSTKSLKSEENLAALNSYFNEITQILIQDPSSGSTSQIRAGPKNRLGVQDQKDKEEILAKILSLEIEIDKIHKINEEKVNQSNINEVIDQMEDLNTRVHINI